MDIGNFDKTVTFMVNNSTDLGAGGRDNYVPLLTTRGYLQKGGGSRTNSFSDIEGGESWTLYVRQQRLLTDNLSMSLKVLIRGLVYTMQGWEDIEDKHLYYKFNITKNVG